MKDAFAKACGKEIAFKLVDRRPGDIAECYADTKKAQEVLGWSAQYDIDTMCQDSWRFQSNNPDGIIE